MIQQISSHIWADIGEARPNPSLFAKDGEVTLIDTPELPQDAVAWSTFAKSKGKPGVIVMTDHHGDKTIGTHYVSPPAVVLASEGCATHFGATFKSAEHVKGYIRTVDPDGIQPGDDYVLVAPQVTYRKECRIVCGGQDLIVLELPGKVPHQTCVHIPSEGVVIAAGNLTNGIMPMMWEASIVEWVSSLTKIYNLGCEKVLPVHGPVATRAYVLWFRDKIQEWIEAVRDAIARGETQAEMADRIDFSGAFQMRAGREQFMPEWQRRNTIAIYCELMGLQTPDFGYFKVGRYPKEAIGR